MTKVAMQSGGEIMGIFQPIILGLDIAKGHTLHITYRNQSVYHRSKGER